MNIKTLLGLLLGTVCSISSFAQVKDGGSILILSVNFYTTTFISIPCESFVVQFKDQLKVNEVDAKDSIATLDQFIKDIRFSKKKRRINVDVRAKLFYKNSDGKELAICTDGAQILVDGALVRKNNILLKFILSLIPEEQVKFHNLRAR